MNSSTLLKRDCSSVSLHARDQAEPDSFVPSFYLSLLDGVIETILGKTMLKLEATLAPISVFPSLLMMVTFPQGQRKS